MGLCMVSVYVCLVLRGMYTCKTGHFGNDNLYICLCWRRGYVNM